MVKNNYNAKVWTKTSKIPENVYIEQRVDINKIDPDFYKKGDLIIDTCMGSGSTGICAKELNRHFFGIEIDKDYFKIASKRINKVKVQNTLLN